MHSPSGITWGRQNSWATSDLQGSGRTERLTSVQHDSGSHGPSTHFQVPLDQNMESMGATSGVPYLYPLLSGASLREKQRQASQPQKFIDF